MLWGVYIFLSILAGILSWRKIVSQMEVIGLILIGALWGLVLSSLLPFLLALVLTFQKAVFLTTLLFLLTSAFLIWRDYKDLSEELIKIKNYLKNWGDKNFRILIVAFLLIVIPYLFLVSRVLFIDKDGWYATGVRTAYGDTPFHLMYISSFGFGDNFSPQNAGYAGTASKYPFLPHILSASLIKLGANLQTAFMAPAFVLSFLIIALLIFIPWKITQNPKAAILVPLIFLLSSNLGFLFFFKVHGPDILSAETKFQEVWRDEPTNIPQYNIIFMNVLLGSLLPQRGVLFGLPVFLAVLFLWFLATKRSIIASSLLAGAIPLFHAHTFLALLLVAPFAALLLIYQKKELIRPWIIFFIVISAAALPALSFFKPIGQSSVKFIHLTRGWMLKDDNFLWFWVKNLGFFLPALFWALASKKVPKMLKIRYLPFIFLFIVPNFIVFSPADWDNHKFFNLWYLVSAVPIAYLLSKLLENKNFLVKSLAVFFILLLTIGGSLEALRIWHFSKPGLKLFSPQKQELAQFIKKETLMSSVFLTSTDFTSAIQLSGRKRFLAFLGWLFAHGIDYTQRLKEVGQIYLGGKEAKSLIEKGGITHILVGPEEINEFQANISFFEENYKKIYDKDNYRVYKIK